MGVWYWVSVRSCSGTFDYILHGGNVSLQFIPSLGHVHSLHQYVRSNSEADS